MRSKDTLNKKGKIYWFVNIKILFWLVLCVLFSQSHADEIKYVPCSMKVIIYDMTGTDTRRTASLNYRLYSDKSIKNSWINHWFVITRKDGTEYMRRTEDRPHTEHQDNILTHGTNIADYVGKMQVFVGFDIAEIKSVHLFTMHSAYTPRRMEETRFDYQIYPPKQKEFRPPRYDIDGDGVVGIMDFLLFVQDFGTFCDMARFDSRKDFDRDGEIGIGDFLMFADRFGE